MNKLISNKKIAIIADTHLGCRLNNSHFVDSSKRFFELEFEPYLRKNNIKDIFILGDILDHRESTNTKIMNFMWEIFNVTLKDYTIHIILGNHDTYFKTSVKVHSLVFLRNTSHIKLYENIETIELHDKTITLIPWQVNEEFSKNLYNSDICMGHMEVNGFKFNKFRVSEEGVDQNWFSQFQRTYLGHYHTRSKKQIGDSIVEYVGSPYHLTRNDIGDKRGFTILDLENFDQQFIESSETIKYLKYIYPNVPQPYEVEGNIIDIHVKIDSAFKENELNQTIRAIESKNPLNINTFPIYEVVDNCNNLNTDNVKSVDDMIESYIDKLSENISPELDILLRSYLKTLYERLTNEDN